MKAILKHTLNVADYNYVLEPTYLHCGYGKQPDLVSIGVAHMEYHLHRLIHFRRQHLPYQFFILDEQPNLQKSRKTNTCLPFIALKTSTVIH